MKFIHRNHHVLLMTAGRVPMLVAVFTITTMTSGGSWGVYLLLLSCPAMHLLMHRGMHGSKNRHKMPRAQLPASGKEVAFEKQSRPPEQRD
jgi:hypothetical protein